MNADDVDTLLTPQETAPDAAPFLSSGCRVLNMHLSNDPDKGWMAGKYYVLIGESSTGKTWLAFNAFAEAMLSEQFKDYRLIYDAVEGGADMDIERYFGRKVLDTIEPPAGTREDPQYSVTVEDLYDNLDNAMQDGRPFIYVTDSMDGLTSADDEAKFEEEKVARQKGKTVSGSYGMSKAKRNKRGLLRVTGPNGIRKSGSILFILCQTIDNVGFGFETKSRSGGNSLTFFATAELWLSLKKTITKKVKEKDRPVGVETVVNIKKNRITGRRYEKCTLSIYHSIGIDDIGGCIDYLVGEGWWKANAGRITATEFANTFTKEALVQYIEQKASREAKLGRLVAKCYRQIAAATVIERKRRYE